MLRRSFIKACAAAGAICPLCAALATVSPAVAQQAAAPVTGATGVKGTPIMRTTVSGNDALEAITLSVAFEPGAKVPRHFHYGDEYATLLEGSLELHQEGQPVRVVKAGEAYHNTAKLIHETRNPGAVPAKVLAVFIVEKGKPLVNPVS
jgi:quercetin dioxygenase-like cupin family protein